MKLKEVVEALKLKVYCGEKHLEREVTGGYVSDLLSDVMGHSREGEMWVTLQTHRNVVGIASLKDLSAVVLVKDLEPDQETVAVAREEDVVMLGTELGTFDFAGRLYELLNK